MSSPLAVIYIRTDNGMSPDRQRTACVKACFRERLHIRYWAQGGEGALADALRVVDTGRAHALVAAHPAAIGNAMTQQAIRAHLADIGAQLVFAHSGQPKMTLAPGADLAARMRREGMSEEQIGHVLQIDVDSVRALLGQARRRGLLGISAALLAVVMGAVPVTIEQTTAPTLSVLPGTVRPPPMMTLPVAERPSPSRTRTQTPVPDAPILTAAPPDERAAERPSRASTTRTPETTREPARCLLPSPALGVGVEHCDEVTGLASGVT